MQSSNIAYVPALDHIRAYAALLALVDHGLQLVWHPAVHGAVFAASHWLATGNPLLAYNSVLFFGFVMSAAGPLPRRWLPLGGRTRSVLGAQ